MSIVPAVRKVMQLIECVYIVFGTRLVTLIFSDGENLVYGIFLKVWPGTITWHQIYLKHGSPHQGKKPNYEWRVHIRSFDLQGKNSIILSSIVRMLDTGSKKSKGHSQVFRYWLLVWDDDVTWKIGVGKSYRPLFIGLPWNAKEFSAPAKLYTVGWYILPSQYIQVLGWT